MWKRAKLSYLKQIHSFKKSSFQGPFSVFLKKKEKKKKNKEVEKVIFDLNLTKRAQRRPYSATIGSMLKELYMRKRENFHKLKIEKNIWLN